MRPIQEIVQFADIVENKQSLREKRMKKIWMVLITLSALLHADMTPACGCGEVERLCPETDSGTLVQSELSEAMEALERGAFIEAATLFKTLAERGNFIAQQNLGVMYYNGFGVAKNRKVAAYWFQKAQEGYLRQHAQEHKSFCSEALRAKTGEGHKGFIGCGCDGLAMNSYVSR